MSLSPDEITLLIIIATTLALIAFSRIPTEIVAVMVLLVLNFSGIVSDQQIFSGFSSNIVITLIGLFVITHTLEVTGVIQWIASRLSRLGAGSEVRLTALFMATGSALSLIMNNVAAGAVLLPAAVRVAQMSNVRVSKLLIPMSFGTLVGGMATYLTTANIVMSELLIERGFDGLNMLDFIPTGGLIVLASLAYMMLIGRRLLPVRESITETTMQATDLQQTYQLDERMWELRITPQSTLADVSLAQSHIGEELGLTVLAIWHGRYTVLLPKPTHMLGVGDHLLVVGRQERIEKLMEWGLDLVDDAPAEHHQHDLHLDLTEVIIPPRSSAIGRSLVQLKFRQRWGLTTIAMWRGGRSYRTDVRGMKLEVGDALLVSGDPEKITQLADDVNYIVPQRGYPSVPMRPQKALIALAITSLVLALAIFNVLPLSQVMLAGAVAMVLTGSLDMREFYKAIEWKVIFLIAGMLPLSIAMSQTGLASRVGDELVTLLESYDARVLIAGIFMLTVLVTQVIGGQVSALLVGPIAINAALRIGVNPQAMAVTVAIGCSTAFLTPIAHPVNILMMGPGGYTFGDFFRVGVGMTVITLITLLVGLAVFWGIH